MSDAIDTATATTAAITTSATVPVATSSSIPQGLCTPEKSRGTSTTAVQHQTPPVSTGIDTTKDNVENRSSNNNNIKKENTGKSSSNTVLNENNSKKPSKEEKKPAATTSSTVVPRKKRRSRRIADTAKEAIIAPGWGTAADIKKLARQLSSPESNLSEQAVLCMMRARGRGSRQAAEEAEKEKAAPAVFSGWSDFMKEAGVGDAAAPKKEEEVNASGRKKRNAASAGKDGKATSNNGSNAAAAGGSGSAQRTYKLPVAELPSAEKLTPKKKKQKQSDEAAGGVLMQTGTLDNSIVGRTKLSTKDAAGDPWHLQVPTSILPGVKITKVFSSPNACHSVAIDENGTAYGWGRNEARQLGSLEAQELVLPCKLDLPEPILAASMGKSHTLFLSTSGTVYAVGLNKAGQCSVKGAGETVSNFRKCHFEEKLTPVIVQIACGEDFSLALSDQGHLYSTGSSEFGQLANGETGEYFVSANKLAFANCSTFTRRTTFCHAPDEKLYTSADAKVKVSPYNGEDIRICSIAAGKHHGLAVEAFSEPGSKQRVFSWGCGDYGCLGHGVQKDEYFPRLVGVLYQLPVQSLTVQASNDDNDNMGNQMVVTAGASCSLLQTGQGHVYYWGKHKSAGEATMRPKVVEALANNGHVVNHCAAGAQTVICCTNSAQTVAWGQGPHGELGFGAKKSSSKPDFVASLDGQQIMGLAAGYGHTLYLVQDDDDKKAAAVEKLPELNADAVEPLIKAIAAKPPPAAPGKKKS